MQDLNHEDINYEWKLRDWFFKKIEWKAIMAIHYTTYGIAPTERGKNYL